MHPLQNTINKCIKQLNDYAFPNMVLQVKKAVLECICYESCEMTHISPLALVLTLNLGLVLQHLHIHPHTLVPSLSDHSSPLIENHDLLHIHLLHFHPGLSTNTSRNEIGTPSTHLVGWLILVNTMPIPLPHH